MGKITGLPSGSTHAVHIIEYSDIIDEIQTQNKNNKNNKEIYYFKNPNEIKLNHFNPLKYKHSCPSTNSDEQNYHFGDLGNIIANNKGEAFISIIKKISLNSLNGRTVIITNSPDKCQENNENDVLADVIATGQLTVLKPTLTVKTNGSQEYFLREINSVNKHDFLKKQEINDKNNLKKEDIKFFSPLLVKRKEEIKIEKNKDNISENNQNDNYSLSKFVFKF